VSLLFGHRKGIYTGATTSHRGFFEAADGGTLFLNEIGDMPLDVQVKVLRAVQDGVIQRLGENQDVHVDVRLVAATWLDLAGRVADGRFRKDLYHRLNVGHVTLPPLRDRGNDVILIAKALLVRGHEKRGLPYRSLSVEAEAVLLDYSWPGNVRELRDALYRALVFGSGRSLSGKDVLSAIGKEPSPARQESAQAEQPTPLEVLKQQSPMAAADLRSTLGISRSAMSRLLKPLLRSGEIVRDGMGAATRYRLAGSLVSPTPSDPRWDVAMALVHEEGCVTSRDLAVALGVSGRTSTRLLRAMVEAGRLIEQGEGRAVAYTLPTTE